MATNWAQKLIIDLDLVVDSKGFFVVKILLDDWVLLVNKGDIGEYFEKTFWPKNRAFIPQIGPKTLYMQLFLRIHSTDILETLHDYMVL